ncbi:MAG: Na+/H+ antiporter NhaC family protein, partial [Clostridia bacterium]|nr:Na+/H+ antiporter NhaC family protein [Clostridia bacterium]
MKKRNFLTVLALIIMSLALLTVAVGAEGSDAAEQGSKMYATFWALVPPIIAIALALITKEVYMSLFVGILAGALFATNFDPLDSISSISNNIIANAGDSWNMGILVFLVILGIIVSLMTKAGGSAAYGRWAAKKIKSKTGAMLATSALGVLIFVDDYFNCLTVGSVMRPVTDKHGVSRAKLSYIIDATAAPICIIAPISSWAAAVAGYTQTENTSGFTTFIKTIPYNFYAILTIVMLVAIAIMKVDFGSMKIHEDNAAKGDLYTTPDRPYASHDADEISSKGTVLDLILPVIVLIVCCILGMAYAGGVLNGVGFIDALGGDAATGLVIGSLVALIFTFLFYIPRRVITFRQFADSIPEGFKAMVPAIIILVFAWTLGGYCRNDLGAGEFVGNLVGDS